MKHSAHITFITGSMTQIDIEAADADHARDLVFAKFPPGTVSHVSAWPIREPRTFVRPDVRPSFDSAFGALV